MTMAASPRIQDSVGAALHSVRQNWQAVLITAAIGALATTAVQMLGGLAPTLPYLTILVMLAVSAMIYSVLIGLALRGGQPRLVLPEAARLFAAMAIIGFFFAIAGLVLAIVGSIVLVAGPYASMSPQMSAAGDQNAVNRLLEQMLGQNPWPIVTLCGVYFVIWFYLTTRLYLAAPASIDRGRILTFETWSWTKRDVLKIMGARAMLVAPAYVLTTALSYLLGRAVGIDMFNLSAAEPGPGAALIFAIVSAFLNVAIADAAGAALATALYRDLGGQTAQLPKG